MKVLNSIFICMMLVLLNGDDFYFIIFLKILTLACLRCFMICKGFPKSMTGIQAKATKTKTVWKKC